MTNLSFPIASSAGRVFKRYANVYFAEDYATGDGTVDDLAALHNLRDAAGTDAVIYLGGRSRTYVISGPLTASVAGQRWVGDGALVKASDSFSGSQIITATSTSGGLIESVLIDGNGKAADLLRLAANWECEDIEAFNNTEYGITVASCSNTRIRRPKLYQFGKYGIRIQNFGSTTGLGNHEISDPDIDLTDQGVGSTNVAILIRGESNANPMADVHVHRGRLRLTSSPTASGHLGIETRFCNGGDVSGVAVNGGSMHTSIAGSENMTVSGNVAKGQNYYAFEVASPGVSDATTNNVVASNVIDGEGILKTGIAIQGVGTNAHNTVGPNSIQGVIDQGIYVHSTVTDASIHAGNMELSAADYGIYVNNADRVSIHCGNMNGGGVCKKGVYLLDTNDVAIAGGNITGMTENDIYLNVANAIDRVAIGACNLTSSIGANSHIAYGGAGTLGNRVSAMGVSGAYRTSSSYRLTAIHDLKADVVEVVGAGTPEGNVVAGVGSIFIRTDGGASTSRYFKESGTGNTGWVAK